jgi:hypothetical protein
LVDNRLHVGREVLKSRRKLVNWESKMDHLCVFLVQNGETNCARYCQTDRTEKLATWMKSKKRANSIYVDLGYDRWLPASPDALTTSLSF